MRTVSHTTSYVDHVYYWLNAFTNFSFIKLELWIFETILPFLPFLTVRKIEVYIYKTVRQMEGYQYIIRIIVSQIKGHQYIIGRKNLKSIIQLIIYQFLTLQPSQARTP